MTRLKQEFGAELEIIYKFSIVPENTPAVADAIPQAADLGCDKIGYGFDPKTVRACLRGSPELRAPLREQLKEQITVGQPMEIERIRLQHLGLPDELGNGENVEV